MWALKDLCRVSSLRLLYIYYMYKSTAIGSLFTTWSVHSRPFWGKNLQKILAFFLGFTMYLHHAEIYFEKLASMYIIALLFFLIFHQKYTQKSQVIKSQYFLRFFNFKNGIVQFFVYSKKIYISLCFDPPYHCFDGWHQINVLIENT